MSREARIIRKTGETQIEAALSIDGEGNADTATGIGFFDHMLTLFAKHGLFDLKLTAKGDLHIDAHHTVEDAGIVIGQAFAEALGDKNGIARYGSAVIPMDEVLVLCAADLSGRAYFSYDVLIETQLLGGMPSELVEEFFRAFAFSCGMNLHIKLLSGKNGHHIAEGVFKAASRALYAACAMDPRRVGVPSTKGSL